MEKRPADPPLPPAAAAAAAEGVLTGVQVLAATAITGVIQAVAGGQPLLIVGVAEPIILMYKYMWSFAQGQEGERDSVQRSTACSTAQHSMQQCAHRSVQHCAH